MQRSNHQLITSVNQFSIAIGGKPAPMPEHERLRQARLEAGFPTATAAARAMGVAVPSYVHHENGTAGLSRAGRRYATFYRVSYEWLMTGRGAMRDRRAISVPIIGLVGAGATVASIGDEGYVEPPCETEVPSPDEVMAFIVKGDSQYPRFLDGEIVLVGRDPVEPQRMVGRLAMVQTPAGDRMLKIIKRGRREGRWTLSSHNAPDIENVEIMAAWPVRGILTR